ncbi:MAG: SprT-like domain-containing protein [Elusimicrobiota bacterium]
MEVKINYSPKRARTIGARVIKDTMYVNAPAGMPEERLQKIIDKFKIRFEKRKLRQELNKTEKTLRETAHWLSRQYFSGKLEIKSIEYSTDQDKINGSCNHRTKTIRISYRLKEMPDWVRNYVIIHELAHLIEPNHGENFWNLVYQYKLTERARGYLIAKGLESDKEDNKDIEDSQESE